jgi:hypothetical protein
MAAKRKQQSDRSAGKSRKKRKTNPEQVSGISAAAIEGAAEAKPNTRNAEKMARPGPGLPDRRIGRRRGNSESIESTARESAAPPLGVPEDEISGRRAAEEANPDDFDDFGGISDEP